MLCTAAHRRQPGVAQGNGASPGHRRLRRRRPGRRRPRGHAPGLPRRRGSGVRRDVHLHADVLHLRARPALRAGAHRHRPVDRRRGVRAVPPRATSTTFEPCYGLSNPIRNVVVDGPAGGRAARRARARRRSTPSWRRSTRPPPRSSSTRHPTTTTSPPSTSTTGSPATTARQVVTTSWGNCEALAASDVQAENEIFAAHGAAGSDGDRRRG